MLAPLARCDPAKANLEISRLAETAMIERTRLSGVVHLFERPAISRHTHDGPPIVGRLKGLLAVLRHDVGSFDSALCQKLANGLYRNDPLPGIKGSMEIGAKLLYGRPPCRGARLEHA